MMMTHNKELTRTETYFKDHLELLYENLHECIAEGDLSKVEHLLFEIEEYENISARLDQLRKGVK